MHIDPPAGQLDRRVPVDGEVAERMREGRGRCRQRREHDEQDENALHDASLLAVAAQMSEKCGFVSTARANQRFARRS